MACFFFLESCGNAEESWWTLLVRGSDTSIENLLRFQIRALATLLDE